MSRYDDIINLPHHVSLTRTPMPLANRAAQFAPFAALTGHDAAINETARLTTDRLELSADEQRVLAERLTVALTHINMRPELTFTVFRPDKLKSGGEYIRINGAIKRLNESEHTIILTTNRTIRLEDIAAIDGEIFID